MSEMVVLLVGSGGREYELARHFSQSKQVKQLYVAPGNAGTATLAKAENVALAPTDVAGLVAFATEKQVNLAIMGPEAPLIAGVSDALRQASITVFGPSQAAAQLEASKAFAADFMTKHAIPQPNSWTAHSLEEALSIIADKPAESYVLKASGLAGGKGVVLPSSVDQAETTLAAMFSGEGFDGAGREAVVIQERLHGPEVSAFALSDGKDVVLLPFAQDHKRLHNNDQGPNTGGMGAYAPVPDHIVTPDIRQKIQAIAEQTVEGMAADNIPYQGVLFIGLMLAAERGGDPVVIEYNVRFGDPETQVVLGTLAASGIDVAAMITSAANGDISSLALPSTYPKAALTVCLAASGYPNSVRKGDPIVGLDKTYEQAVVHQAGTKQASGGIVTDGGRVLYVTGYGDTLDEAAAHAYQAIGPDAIHFDGMQYRTDIGHQVRS